MTRFEMSPAQDHSDLGHDLRNVAMQLLLRLDVLSVSPGLPAPALADVAAIRAGILRLQDLALDLQLPGPSPVPVSVPPGPPVESGTPRLADTLAFSVFCVDDNRLLIDALERRLSLEPGFLWLHREDDHKQVVETATRLRPTVILLDVGLPDGADAMLLLQTLVRDAPESRVIVFTGTYAGELVARAMGLGARGFASKGITSDRLIAAIRSVVAGESVIALED